jgi:hypothetical protein
MVFHGWASSIPNAEFSPSLVFYVTNDIATTFKFLLHNHLAHDSNNIVVVFCFELDVGILHTKLLTRSRQILKVC